jgi:hypothetical protein
MKFENVARYFMKKNKKLMKRVVFLNDTFFMWQVLFIVATVIFNILYDDVAVFVLLLAHTVFYLVYNIWASTVAESKYIERAYDSPSEKIAGWRHIKRTAVLYKKAKEKTDTLTLTFIKQKAIKLSAWFANLVSVLLMVEFSY